MSAGTALMYLIAGCAVFAVVLLIAASAVVLLERALRADDPLDRLWGLGTRDRRAIRAQARELHRLDVVDRERSAV